jgi:hypothetical protein
MTNSGNNSSRSEIADKNIISEKATKDKDEISLMDYFLVLWKWKKVIILVSVLPALVVGVISCSLQSNYKVTYVYDARHNHNVERPNDVFRGDIDIKSYQLLPIVFYGEENLNKLIYKLEKEGFQQYASRLKNIDNQPKDLIAFEFFPPFLDVSSLNHPEQLTEINEIKVLLLKVTITGSAREDMYKISSVILENIENVVWSYSVHEQLLSNIKEYNSMSAEIEENRFMLELSLKKIKAELTSLKEIRVETPVNKQDNIVLQFNVPEQSQYLPLDFQINAAESKKIGLEEKIKTNQEEYGYHKDLLAVNCKILAELDSKLSSEYSEEQFKAFLNNLTAANEKQEIKEYLNSYIRRIDNIMLAKSVVEKPKIYPLPRA